MRLVLIALSLWTIVVMGRVIAGAFLSFDDQESLFSSQEVIGEEVVTTLLTIPTMLLGIPMMVGL